MSHQLLSFFFSFCKWSLMVLSMFYKTGFFLLWERCLGANQVFSLALEKVTKLKQGRKEMHKLTLWKGTIVS